MLLKVSSVCRWYVFLAAHHTAEETCHILLQLCTNIATWLLQFSLCSAWMVQEPVQLLVVEYRKPLTANHNTTRTTAFTQTEKFQTASTAARTLALQQDWRLSTGRLQYN